MLLAYVIGATVMAGVMALAQTSQEWRDMMKTADRRGYQWTVVTVIVLWPAFLIVAVAIAVLRGPRA